MPANDILTPREASYIATNAYFTLKDWVNAKPVAAQESRSVVMNRVIGPGDIGLDQGKPANPTLQKTDLASARLGTVFSASTGFGTTSGFGYSAEFQANGRKHIVIATRGTRPEMPGKPDLLTDLRGSMTNFADLGPVQKEP